MCSFFPLKGLWNPSMAQFVYLLQLLRVSVTSTCIININFNVLQKRKKKTHQIEQLLKFIQHIVTNYMNNYRLTDL